MRFKPMNTRLPFIDIMSLKTPWRIMSRILSQDHHPNVPVLESVLTCPRCGCAKKELMPTNACQYYYECSGCKALLRPRPGDCCVFCSFGSVKCPPVQAQSACCEGNATGGNAARNLG
jgi:hypothetical protein